MEGSNFRAESHVAQQSRRDKLRIQQSSSLEAFPSNYLEHLSVNSDVKPEFVQVRNVSNANLMYDPSDFSSDMVNFSGNSNVLDVGQSSKNMAVEICQQGNLNAYRSTKGEMSSGLGNCRGTWSQQSHDWMANFASGLTCNENIQNVSAFTQSMKPGYRGYQDVQSSITNPSSEIPGQNRDEQYEDMHFNPLIHSSIQDPDMSAVATDVLQSSRENVGGRSWADSENELALLPVYGNQTSDITHARMKRPINHLGSYLDVTAKRNEEELRNIVTESNTRGLSLSLSSNLPSQQHMIQFGGTYDHEELHSRNVTFKEAQGLKDGQTVTLCSIPRPSIIGKGAKFDVVGTSTCTNRITGPLGPFTGYATILKNSKFLNPTQQLLDEFCSLWGLKLVKTCGILDKISRDVTVSADANEVDQSDVRPASSNLAASSSTFYSSDDVGSDVRAGSSSTESYLPEYLQRKTKLLYMQEEICRRYKQYHRQMQMVVSSFESVAGLSAATPHISIALKTVSRHFRCLKHVISDQLQGVNKVLGEDLSSPTTGTGTSCSKDQVNVCRLKNVDQSFQKEKPGDNNLRFFERQHVWRPQRGLPERAVAILRAWLFEHFLHPYPTDTDKHVLASQTGLTRNQVSNWFINARVRLWKPMVEEIHMLENGAAKVQEPSAKTTTDSPVGVSQSFTNLGVPSMPEKQSGSTGVGLWNAEYWNQKRPRVDCQIPPTMDPSSLGFVPYQRTGTEIGGSAGAISLTLGLQHNVETAQRQQQQLQQQEEDQLRWQFRGPVIHDFVG